MKETASQRKKDKVLRTSMYVAVLIGLAGFLIFSVLAAITFGNADLSLKDVYSVIAYKLFHIKSLSAYAEGAVHDVVWLIRLVSEKISVIHVGVCRLNEEKKECPRITQICGLIEERGIKVIRGTHKE